MAELQIPANQGSFSVASCLLLLKIMGALAREEGQQEATERTEKSMSVDGRRLICGTDSFFYRMPRATDDMRSG
ncbi:MAG TPA: hypothetical protein PLS23_04005 [Phycisphaerae bacterium]|nr:hypothetical protein [Phycisphaerae bacterium]